MTAEEALNRIAGLCSQKELCSCDVREKLIRWEVPEKEIARILEFLYQHKFVDDHRFALSYARDKFRFNKWGTRKIAVMLQQKKIAPELIREALHALPREECDTTCRQLLMGKMKTLKGDNPYQMKAKLVRFAAGRGFDFDTIQRCISGILPGITDGWDE